MGEDTQLILKAMLDKDKFSAWLGIVVDAYKEGYCKLHYTIREEMLNGFGIVHGGIIFSGADSAFAFACNSHGRISVALDVHISFVNAAKAGDKMIVEAKELHTGNKVSFYDVVTTNEEGTIISIFKGTAYRTGKQVCGG
jgi:acyl-CoA thioesterase